MSWLRIIPLLVFSYMVSVVIAMAVLSVGGRGQDSTEMHGGPVTTATPQASSSHALVPAPSDRAVGDEVAVPLEEIQAMLPVLAAPPVEPASTVTQSALTATVQAYLVIDPVPATPPSQRVPVGSYAPWPEYLWPVVACLVSRESKGNPLAIGSAAERGLLQVHPITWPYLAGYGITPDGLFDPATNIRAGYLLYLEAGGLRPWGGSC